MPGQSTEAGSAITPSIGNQSTTALGSGATYTGTWEQALGDGVTVSLEADNSGTLYFDFSNDGGSNFTTFPSNGFSVASGIHEYHRAAVNGRSFRVRLVNDSGAQSYLRLYTYYGPHTHPSAPVNQTLGADADAMVVRQFPTGVDLALGRLGGVTATDKFGHVEGLDAADAPTDMWAYGDDGGGGTSVHPFPTSSAVARIASSDNSDTVDVTYTYIDANGAEQEATVTLTGQTPVVLPSMLHVNRAFVDDASEASGNITISHDADWTGGVPDNLTETLAYIKAGWGQTNQMLYVVPSGKQMIVKRVYTGMSRSSGAAGSAEVHLRTRASGKSSKCSAP